MIPACKDPPAPVPQRAPGAQRASSKDQASSFDDALRESGGAPVAEKTAPAKEAPVKEASTKAAPMKDDGDEPSEKKTADAGDAPQSTPVAPQVMAQPVALEALLAQVLPPAQQSANAPAAPQTAPEADMANLPKATLAQAVPSAPRDVKASEQAATKAPDVAAAVARVANPAPAQAAEVASPEGEDAGEISPGPVAPDSAGDAAPARQPAPGEEKVVPASLQGDGRSGAGDKQSDAESDAAFRPVAVRQVSSTTHFPVVADPVRQIASEVTRALEEPVATPGAAAPGASTAAQPVKTLQVQLEPEALGTVTLRLRLSGNHLSVRVDVAEPATLDMIQREHDRLQKSMTSDHVSIDRLEIRPLASSAPVQNSESAGAPKQDMNAQQGQQQQQPQQPRPQAEAGAGDGRGRFKGREQQETGLFRNDRQDTASNRGGDSRGLYL